MYVSSTLPPLQADEQAHCHAVTAHIRAVIDAAGGCIPFSHYMERALYAPALGYYSAGAQKFGAGGDFITAPEISPLFSQCLAQQCAPVLAALNAQSSREHVAILELGAGSGNMAADGLLALEAMDQLPTHYFILEVSAELKARQRATLQARCPHLLQQVSWLDQLPNKPFRGIILANEVLDAIPVERFRIRDQTLIPQGVCWQQGRFTWCDFNQQGDAIAKQLPIDLSTLPNDYRSEINTQLPAYIASLSDCLAQGMMLFIDYGEPRAQYYQPNNTQGTLRCYYRHHVHDDPFLYPGLQDITAHVDFTHLAESADAAGLTVAGFTTQAAFLISLGITELAAQQDSSDAEIKKQLTASQHIQQLTHPGEMGERFKAMALTKALDIPLAGFALQDQRYRL